jgi:four helix bundle protein
MPRIDPALTARIEAWTDRCLSLCDVLAESKCPRWLAEQFGRASTSVGANFFEADQAMSRSDFCKCLAICLKELNESRFWIRTIGRRGWVPLSRLGPLESESVELLKILNSMVVRSRPVPKLKKSRDA